MNQKEKYQKSQIDRLNRQVSDLKQENLELRDEIAHYDQQLSEAREAQFNNDYQSNKNTFLKQKPAAQNYSGIGQGVINKHSNDHNQDPVVTSRSKQET